MSYSKHGLTAIVTLIVTIGLLTASFSPAGTGYEFPKIVAIFMVVIAITMVVLTLLPKKSITADDEESIPWGSIWPALLILIGFLLVAGWLGFFATSFIAFYSVVMIYSPERLCWHQAIRSGVITAVFMGVLYLIFVTLLNVQIPGGILI
ncbi:tripartite tricarboxylate transporter TctB family protein [Pistricoccus aurantiacus]|uniref:Tripartite tricarboxylate transporter TctB family protein n=1 Tax=Pistricoccus aurantiacus TaxID=1883414 RepID=A0A5B8SUL6_9GAMM|nr:tripartite tricarboxylate transporter TctB family protein [Pistricoccus aurantiacus]QEA39205.1 tripartite tricarboxylate transporter TctB family protein [Pistricoccus aurantiacus]